MLLSGVISAEGFFSAFLPYIVALGPFPLALWVGLWAVFRVSGAVRARLAV